jgi:DUF1009 family protein
MSRIGIIAGGGSLPQKLVDACKHGQRDFFVLALQGQADKSLVGGVPHKWVRIGATDEAISILKSEHVDEVVMAGSVRRPGLLEMKPDWRTVQVFARLGLSALGDDVLLRAVAGELEKDGFKVIGAHEIEPALITAEGLLTKKTPSAENNADLQYAIKTVKTLGQLDIGQAAVVQQGIVLGVEAVEGTDGLLKRCKGLRRKGHGGVLVKGCKPQQDQRMDMPVIGTRTVKMAYEAGLEGIAAEAGVTLILDRDAVIEAADKFGLFVTGFKTP